MRTRSIVCLVLFLSLAAPAVLADNKSKATPGVVPPQARYEGKTYAEWGAEWWKWAYSMPVSENPLWDYGGPDREANLGVQSGHVWFLAGVMGLYGPQDEPVTLTRNVTIPAGKALFFPVLNNELNNDEMMAWLGITLSEEDLMALLIEQTDSAQDMEVTVDGKKVASIESYRGTCDAPFEVTEPADDSLLEVLWGIDPAPTTIYPEVSDGFWIMLTPLPVGRHVVHFKGAFVMSDWTFGLDITYNIKVVPGR